MIEQKIDRKIYDNNLLARQSTGSLCLLISSSHLLFLVMSDNLDHATGIEKRELLARAAGNDDPFDMKLFKRGAGTKEQPNLIPSAFDARLVGCICKYLETIDIS